MAKQEKTTEENKEVKELEKQMAEMPITDSSERKDAEVSVIEKAGTGLAMYSNINSFLDAQRMARMLSQSSLVPKVYQNNIPNTMLALEMSHRNGVSPFMVMQNLDIIQGKPSWRSTFIIAALNSCGRFSPLRFEQVGTKPTPANKKPNDYGYRAYAYSVESGDRIEGPVISWEMVNAEGWYNKADSKWKTMAELMFRYRSAAFFGRLYAPDILIGMQTAEETIDIGSGSKNKPDNAATLKARVLKHIKHSTTLDELEDCERSIEDEETREKYEQKKAELQA